MHKVICITGASSGIGLATGLAFAGSGWTVYAGTRHPERDRSLYAGRQNLIFTYMDVTAPDSLKQALSNIEQQHGRLDVLFCNAGYGMLKALEQAEQEDIHRLFATNVYGVMSTITAALPLLRQSGGGHIIITSSIAGVAGQALNEIYCASKFAVEGLAESLAVYYKPFFNIDITLLEPGAINTNFSNVMMEKIAADGGFQNDEYKPVLDAFLATFGANTVPQSAESVAEIVLKLAEMEVKPLKLRTSEAANRFVAAKLGQDPTGLAALQETRQIQLGL